MPEKVRKKRRMRNGPGSIRWWITAGVLLGSSVLLRTASHGEPIVPRQPLREIPYTFAAWTGEERPIEERIVQAVSVSDYTNRIYFNHGDAPVRLYVAYYASQRGGDTIHSPKNCLPGAGWDPIHSGYTSISVAGGRQIVVNEYVIERDLDKQLVFYWYQGRGRVIANEYWGKFWMMTDAIARNRTDGALIRLVTTMNDGEAKARGRLVTFTQILFPYLDESIPN
jgi:EpsI family protein